MTDHGNSVHTQKHSAGEVTRCRLRDESTRGCGIAVGLPQPGGCPGHCAFYPLQQDIAGESFEGGHGAAHSVTRAELVGLHNDRGVANDGGDKGYAAARVAIAFFAGLRISEIRGLARPTITLTGRHPKMKVVQRADNFGRLGPLKSEAAYRTISLGSAAVTALRRWITRAPSSDQRLVFPNGIGRLEGYANIYHRIWTPLLVASGVTKTRPNSKGKKQPPPRAKYGMHVMRHAAASLWIEQGLQPKLVQQRMGHSTLQMTMDL